MPDFKLNSNPLPQALGGHTAIRLPWGFRFEIPRPSELGLTGPFALSVMLHAAILVLTAGGIWTASQNPYGILVERFGVPGAGIPAEAEFEVDYSAPSDISLGAKKKKTKKVEVTPAIAAEKESSGGGGRLGNATSGAESGQMGDPNGIQVSPKERYLYELKHFFDQRKTYPASARTLGQQGLVEVAFEVDANGNISQVTLLKPSSYEKLNQAAVALVKNAGAFKAIPKELGMQKWQLSVPIRYELN